MSSSKIEHARLADERVFTPELATSMTEKVLTVLMNKSQTEEIEDDRYVNVVSRTQSRFASPLSPNQIVSLEIHPSGKSLAYSRADGSLTVWVMTGPTFARSRKLYVANAVGRDKSVSCLSWDSTEMNQLATVCNGSEVLVWAVDEKKRTMSKVRTISVGAKLKLHTCAYDPTGRWLLALAKSEELYLFDARKDHELHTVSDLKQLIAGDSVHCLAWNNTGSHLFLGLKSGKLALLEFDASNGFKLCMSVDAHRGLVSSIAVDPWGRFVVTGGSDGICVVWDISSMCCSVVIDGLDSPIASLSIDHLGKCVALCTEKGDLRFYDLHSGKCLLRQKMGASGSDLVARFYPDRTWLIIPSKWDILERHFTPSTYNDALGLWKAGHEKPKIDLRNRNVTRKSLKRSRENDKNDRGRAGKRESSRGGRFSERR
ncbi:hypothetical protein HG536_0B01250 [Torulaspora globosa]|uniref:Uncharacterized protein n=1 Tax=Torulaspora globosa TaxID=48254 RepID=A0A7G3ZCM8_9SACH|nr:uncharacterized protein HG536_0B01250 [Torulaspora globosa]QLL31264.1 hypothetical protein HG536_0B01250 [Torulaspora globosa]